MDNPRARHWCFTINNPELTEEEVCNSLSEASYAIFQLEVGDEGTPHYQGYCMFSKQQYLATVRRWLPGAHLSVARGTPAQNRSYCSKEDGRIGDFCEIGIFPEQERGKRTDLIELHQRLQSGLTNKQYAQEYFDLFIRHPSLVSNFNAANIEARDENTQPRSWLLIGPSGYGKSRFARRLAKHLGGGLYRHCLGKWFDGYRGERTLLFDDFRGSSLSFTDFKCICDRYPIRVEVKGTSCELAATNFIFTANTEPTTWWKEEVTGMELEAIFRRIGKTLWFTAENTFVTFPSYTAYGQHALVPLLPHQERPPVQEEVVQYPYEEDEAVPPSVYE